MVDEEQARADTHAPQEGNGEWDSKVKQIGAWSSLLLLCVFWVSMAQLLQFLQDAGSTYYYANAYALAWFMTAGFLFFIPVWMLMRILEVLLWKDSSRGLFSLSHEEKVLCKASLVLGVFVLMVNVFWAYSLARTSVSANTAIYNTQNVFVYIMSIPVLREALTVMKSLSVVLCVSGVILMSFASSTEEESGIEQSVWGYVLVLASTVTFAAYEVLYAVIERKFLLPPKEVLKEGDDIPEHSSSSVAGESISFWHHVFRVISDRSAYVGGMGLTVAAVLWIPIPIMNAAGWDSFEWPDIHQSLLIVGVIACDNLFFFFLSLAIEFSSPLWVSTGTLLTVPFSVISDAILHTYLLPPLAWVALALIILGFCGLSLADYLLLRFEKSPLHSAAPKGEVEDDTAFARIALRLRPLWRGFYPSCC